MAQQEHVTDTQIERMDVAIHQLAKRNNAWGIGISKQIAGKPLAEKRRTILGAYGQMFEALLSLNMAMDSTRTPEQIAASLEKSGGNKT